MALRERCTLKGYSPQTFKTYASCVRQYLQFCERCSLNQSSESVKSYLLHKDISVNASRLHHAALKFLFSEILQQPFTAAQVPVKKRPQQLPKVISKEQVKELIDGIGNVKHRLVVKLLYSCGLRLQELINLKRSDIDFEQGLVRVNKGKGSKDRITIISQSIKDDLATTARKNSQHGTSLRGGRGSTRRSPSRRFSNAMESASRRS